jgi:eukaryotic-like serine/threonine-protein kinase
MATVEPGTVIGGRYELRRILGTGGMARVWLGYDRLLDREVAVKILAERYAADPDFVERFRREASSAAGLQHPNIVAVFDRGETDGSYYIVMEQLPGPDLKHIIKRRGRLTAREAVDAAQQVLAALGAAHRRNVIHRDIKPQNVLLAEDGHLKVTDFGIARAGEETGITDAKSVIGTAQYLSPEQARGEDVTAASDCYAVGVMLYEMLTGRVPFDGDRPVAVAMRQINEPPIPPRTFTPDIPPALEEIVMKALAKRPANRYRTAEELAAALAAVRPSLPGPESATAALPVGAESAGATLIMGPPTGTTLVGGPPTSTTAVTPPPRQPTGPTAMPPSQPRRRAPIIVAIVVLLLLAGGAAAYFLLNPNAAAQVLVPNVAGQEAATAGATLSAKGFQVSPRAAPSDKVDAGLAIRTDPAAGQKADKGSQVILIVSNGPTTGSVPTVDDGKSLEEAVATLQQEGFTATTTREFSDTVDKGNVISQDPPGGSSHKKSDPVKLVVSKGPEPVDVPSLLLLSQDQAAQALADKGLTVGTVSEKQTSKRAPGTVLAQSPTAGTSLAKGDSVDLTVAKAPPVTKVQMPNVIGQDIRAARRKLVALGFPEPSGSSRPSNEPQGTVIETSPPPGAQFDPTNTSISLIYSAGPDIPTAPSNGGTTVPAPGPDGSQP